MKNEYEVRGDVTAIKIVSARESVGTIETLVDTSQLDRLLTIDNTWSVVIGIRGPWYVRSQIAKRQVKLHRLLTDASAGLEVHHVNGDSLDNRLSNLRVIASGDHRRIHSFVAGGVGYEARRERYTAWIDVDGNQYVIGSFLTLDEAISARKGASFVKSIYTGRVTPTPWSELATLAAVSSLIVAHSVDGLNPRTPRMGGAQGAGTDQHTTHSSTETASFDA